MRSFNTAGPVKPDRHYCIPPLERIDLDDVLRLVRDERYFVLHAPRQTGKTSALLALAEVLNGSGLPVPVRYGRNRPHRARRRAASDAHGARKAGLAGAGDAGRRLSGRHLAGHSGAGRTGRGTGRSAFSLGAGVARTAGAADRRDRHAGGRFAAVGAPATSRRLPNAPGAFSAQRGPVRHARPARLPHGRRRRQSVQHRREVAAAGRLLARGHTSAAGPAHRADRPGVRAGGAGRGVDPDPRPALAGQRAGVRCLLREQRHCAKTVPAR